MPQPLRQLFDDRGLSEAEIARRLGVHKNTVSNWVTGRTELVPKRVLELAAILGVGIDELVHPEHPPGEVAKDDARSASTAESDAIDVLRRLLDSAGAVRSMHQAAPKLMDVLSDAEALVKAFGGRQPPRGPRRSDDG